MALVLALDQGTTGSTALVFDAEREIVGRGYREITQHFPRPGWVEQDAGELWAATRHVARQALDDAGAVPGDVVAVGLTNQRETVCVWDPRTGEPLHRAIVWQDRRTAGACAALREAGHEPLVRERTGLVLDPYFSATKIAWMLEHVDGLRARVEAGTAVFGTVDAWIAFNLIGEHVTDPSNASRTMLYDIVRGVWDEELCGLLDIPSASLPQVRPSIGEMGTTRPDVLFGHAVPLAGVAGDQQAALYGQACLDPGDAKNTYGTGAFVLLNTGDAPPPPAPGVIGTVGWQIGRRTTYALEASIFMAGAAVQWLRDGLRIIDTAAQSEELARSLRSNDGVYLVPAHAGLGAPQWDPYARGTIVGLTGGSGRAHLARATLEAIAYQTVDAVRAMEEAGGTPAHSLKADGGATTNGWLMQFQADVLGVPVILPQVTETTALGAASLAGVGVGLWTQDAVVRGWRERTRHEPLMGQDERESLLHDWHRAVERSRDWAHHDAPPADPGE